MELDNQLFPDDADLDDMPGIAPGHHAMAPAAFSWGDVPDDLTAG